MFTDLYHNLSCTYRPTTPILSTPHRHISKQIPLFFSIYRAQKKNIVVSTNFNVWLNRRWEYFIYVYCIYYVWRIGLYLTVNFMQMYEGESHENLKLHVASGAAIFTQLLRRHVVFLHRTATCRPLFKPWVSMLSIYRQSSCASNFYRAFKVFHLTLPRKSAIWWWPEFTPKHVVVD